MRRCISLLGISVRLFIDRSAFSFSGIYILVLAGITNGLSFICDIVIAVGMCWYLQSSRSGFKRTDSMIKRLMIYTIHRGALTSYVLH